LINPHRFQYDFTKSDPSNLVIVRTPFRVSFLGGGTDYPEYYLRQGGQVLATSIDKYAYFTLNRLGPLVQERFRLHYSRLEAVNSVDEIQHPAIRGCFQYLGIDDHMNLSYTADLPARTGLGSSSCFLVGLLHALHAYHRRLVHQKELAMLAIHIEQQVLHENVGSQDQYMCALGNLRHVKFETDGTIHSELLPLSRRRRGELESRLMLFFTSITRYASQNIGEQMENTRAGKVDAQLSDMYDLVDAGRDILAGEGPLEEFGRLLDEAWRIKRSLSTKVSNPLIDGMYEAAKAAGAVGGKLLGAGGGGFLMLLVPPDRQDAVRAALKDHPEISFAFDTTGSQLLYVN
jgi:D-glycero-alpha-D-manno-heptose-7-phosphate kinase